MSQIVRLVRRNLATESDRYFLRSTIGEVEVQLLRLHRLEFAGAIELRLHLLDDVGSRDGTMPLVFVGISGELEGKWSEPMPILIGDERESLVSHGNFHRVVRFIRHHGIPWYSD